MEIRMQIDDEFLQSMMSALNMKGTDVVRESLTILNWAIKEIRRGRVILSSDQRGRNTSQLAMPSLERVVEANGRHSAA
jgi:hypothetical protein